MQCHLVSIALVLSLVTPLAAQQVDREGTTYEQIPTCVHTLRDQATGNCVGVSSTPTIGMLYPLSSDFYLNAAGLQLGTEVFLDEALYGGLVDCSRVVVRSTGVQVLNGGSVGLFDFGSPTPSADLHIQRHDSAELLLEADWDNSGEFEHPRILFSQDAGLVQGYVGYQDGLNDLTVRNLYTGGGMRFDLYSTSTRDWEFRRRTSATTDVEARITQSGSLQLDGSVSSPAADLAEFYPVEGNVAPGDVVAFMGNGLALERARTGAAGRLAGVISSRPAFTMGVSYTDEDDLAVTPEPFEDGMRFRGDVSAYRIDRSVTHEIQTNRRAPLALAGRVPVKVTAANGRIRPGDRLTVSSRAGYAMLATETGVVIGTALEAWESGEGKILVFVNVGWYAPIDELAHARDVELLRQELAEMRSLLDGR